MTTEDVNSTTDVSTVAVGFDGSDQARDALALGAEFARLLAARLAVVVVYPFGFLVDLGHDINQAMLRRDAEPKLADAAGDLLEGLRVELPCAGWAH